MLKDTEHELFYCWEQLTPSHSDTDCHVIILGQLTSGHSDTDCHVIYYLADTVFIPVANLGIKLRSLKDFYLDNSDVKVYGPEVDSCSADMLVGKMVTDAPDSVEVTSASFEVKIDNAYTCVLHLAKCHCITMGSIYIYGICILQR